MLKFHGKDIHPVRPLLLQNIRQRHPRREFPDSDLDQNLPNADDTQKQDGRWIIKNREHAGTEFPWFGVPPHKHMRVKQNFHDSPNQNSSGKGSSKSGAI